MADRPNILFIFADQLHYQALGRVDSFFQTPVIDSLADDAMVFERSFCTTPQCSPSRSSMLTGFYPSTTGVRGNVGNAGGEPLRQPTIGLEFQRAGYRTGYFGKWHLGDDPTAAAGWDEHRFEKNDPEAEQRAVTFIEQSADHRAPFALFVSINNPHDIYQYRRHDIEGDPELIPLPDSWHRETFEGKPAIQRQFMDEDQGTAIDDEDVNAWKRYHDCYRAKTRLFDQHVGAILHALKTHGQWENTVIVVTSDHGDMDTHHRLIFKGPFLYEQMVRVPLMIRVPEAFGGIGVQHDDEHEVVNVDLVPTLRELCDLQVAPSHGRSLAPLLRGESVDAWRDCVVAQYYSKQKWINPIRMIRTERYKLNRHQRFGDELYDLANDPMELHNVADDAAYAEVKGELVDRLGAWLAEHDDPFGQTDSTDREGQPLGV